MKTHSLETLFLEEIKALVRQNTLLEIALKQQAVLTPEQEPEPKTRARKKTSIPMEHGRKKPLVTYHFLSPSVTNKSYANIALLSGADESYVRQIGKELTAYGLI